MANDLTVIEREHNGVVILQREDGYLNATAMCKANGKLVAHWLENQATNEFLDALAVDIGIPISSLVQVQRGGRRAMQGTWMHPRAAIHCAMWCNPSFAVRVTGWVQEIATKGHVDLRGGSEDERLLRLIVQANAPLVQGMASLVQLLGQVAQMLPAPRSQFGPLILPDDRLAQRWPNVDARNRRRVRDKAVGLLWKKRGLFPTKLGDQENSPIAFEQMHLDILDEAIDQIMERADEDKPGPLFPEKDN